MVCKLGETMYSLVWSWYNVVSPPFGLSSTPLEARAAITWIRTPNHALRAPRDVVQVTKLRETIYGLVWSWYDVVSPLFELSSPPLEAHAAISLIRTPDNALRAPRDVQRGTGDELRSSIAKLWTPFVYRQAPNNALWTPRDIVRPLFVVIRCLLC